MQASLYLIPVTLGDTEHRRVLPEYNRDVILGIRHFIVENVRTARRFLAELGDNLRNSREAKLGNRLVEPALRLVIAREERDHRADVQPHPAGL